MEAQPFSKRLWLCSRLLRCSWAVLVAVAIGLVFTAATDQARSSMLLSGDFPGFYAPAQIVYDGQTDRLYDAALQSKIENTHWPWFRGQYYQSVYPPYVAQLLSPLVSWGPYVARHIWTAAVLLATLAALVVQCRVWGISLRWLPVLFCYLVLFAPSFVGIFGGQNTAMSALLVVGASGAAYRGVMQQDCRWEYFSGALIGLWWFKPQYGLLASAVLLFGGQYRACGGSVAVGSLYYCLAASVFGMDWPIVWIQALRDFSEQNYQANAAAQISLPGFVQVLTRTVNAPVGVRLGLLLLLAGWACWLLWYLGREFAVSWRVPNAELRARAAARAYLVMGACLPLVSPQALFYDLGIGIVCALPWLEPRSDRRVTMLLMGALVVFALVLWREALPLPVLALVNAWGVVLICKDTCASSAPWAQVE